MSSCKWKSALPEFTRAAEVMLHANQSEEHAVANLYLGATYLYSGDSKKAFGFFSNSFDVLSEKNSQVASLAAKFKLSAEMESSSNITTDYSAWLKDPEIAVALGKEPTDKNSIQYKLWQNREDIGQYEQILSSTESQSILDQTHTTTFILNQLDQSISTLPLANASEVSVDQETKILGQILKSGENILSCPNNSCEVGVIANWIIARALLLRGNLFQFNANALMAEAMYRAAIEKLEGDAMTLPRVTALKYRANRELGTLLSKWDKRESEGMKLIEQFKDGEDRTMAFNRVIPTIAFAGIDRISQ